MEGEVVRILLVEDSEDDALLLLAALERGGCPTQSKRVETAEEFLAALRTGLWDVVVSDYKLPEFSGPDALRLLRERHSDIPFIAVSGVYGEEKAVAMMRAGANDYILKENLFRLAPALRRELEAAADRRSHKRAEGAIQFLAAIVESSEDAIYGKNLDSIIVSWNPAAERLFGYSAEEVVGRSNAVLFPLERRDELLDILATVRRGETAGIRETERLHKSGRIIPVSVTVSPIMAATGEIIGASSIARDITAQKLAAYEREQLIEKLTAANRQVKTLAGMLPICASCKSIRDDSGYWQQVETYISKHSDAIFSHGLCPKCAEEYLRQFDLDP